MRTLLTAIALCFAASFASAATLDFSGNICSGGLACSNGNAIDQDYGDMTGVDVQYDGNPGTPGAQNFLFWGPGYSDLTNVAYYASGAQLTFMALTGYDVGVQSLDLGAWPNTDRDLGFSITDMTDNSVVFDTGLVTVSGDVASSFNPGVSSSTGLILTFFGDFFNGGVDNIVYSATPNGGGTSPVPLPAGGLLLATAILGCGLMRRKA